MLTDLLNCQNNLTQVTKSSGIFGDFVEALMVKLTSLKGDKHKLNPLASSQSRHIIIPKSI